MMSSQVSTRNTTFTLILLAAAGAFALTMGVRQTMGLFLPDLNQSTGLGIANISLAFAFGQLWWGLTQPFAGAASERFGIKIVLLFGISLVSLGTLITPYMTSTLGLIFSIGILAAGGAGIAGPSVLMATVNTLIPSEKRGMATGIVNAGGSFGQFLMAPIAVGLTALAGWAMSMQMLGLLVLLALPAAWMLSPKTQQKPLPASSTSASPQAATSAGESTLQAIRRALSLRDYQLLAGGFFVCGFHVAFLATHLPNIVANCGLPPAVSGWALAILGLFNIAGSLLMGWAVGRWRMKSLLSLVYGVRALAIIVFMLSPKTATVMLIFAAVMGLSYLSTVPPTAGLVARFFGPQRMATLFGIVMLSHQIGGFLGAWLGGKLFVMTGNYDTVWMIDIALAVIATLLHLPIKEAPVARPQPA